MKSKKVITLSLSDLKDLGVIPRKNKKKHKKRKGKKPKYIFVDPNTGAIIGGAKSDSSHMQGYAQSLQASQNTNTANISSAIQEENLKAIERANRKAEKENQKEEVAIEEPKPMPNQLLLDYDNSINTRFKELIKDNNNRFDKVLENNRFDKVIIYLMLLIHT
jgi:hypothetical protein